MGQRERERGRKGERGRERGKGRERGREGREERERFPGFLVVKGQLVFSASEYKQVSFPLIYEVS